MNPVNHLSDENVDVLRDKLARAGFTEPHDGWIANRLQDISFEFARHQERRDAGGLAAKIKNAGADLEAVKRTIDYLAWWRDHLTAERMADNPYIAGAWDPPPASPTAEEVAAYLTQPEWTVDEIETADRVLQALAHLASGIHGYHIGNRVMSPVRKEKPEIDVVIGGLVRMWCQAMAIPETDIKISASAGSPAMNFVEAGYAVFFPDTPTRETIERHVIDYRKEKRSRTH